MLTGAWVAQALLTGALVAVAAWAAEGLCRAYRRPARFAWPAAMLLLVALVGRAAIPAPVHTVGGTVMLPTAVRASTTSAPGTLARLIALASHAGDGLMRHAIAPVLRMVPRLPAAGLAALWVLASLATVGVVALVHLRVTRARRAWPLAELHGHPVHIAPTLGPAVLGVVKPFIVVPRWLLARSAEEQRLVLAHEAEHVRARDHLLLTAAWLVVALVPWHPVAWWMLARLRLAIELDCDARVLRRGVGARTYGTMLIDLAGQCSGMTAGATALADETSHLERRLLAMKQTASRHSHLRAALLLGVGLLAGLAACEAKLPTSADVEQMDVASAEQGAKQVRLLDDHSNATYYVDGVKTDAATAHAIPHDMIGSVDVTKLNGATEIRISKLTSPRPRNADGTSGPIRMKIRVTGDSGESSLTATALRLHHGAMSGDPVVITREGTTSGGVTKISSTAFTGLVIIDGVKVDASKLGALDPKSIVSMEVMKGAAATAKYPDALAVNGVITITTKAGAQ